MAVTVTYKKVSPVTVETTFDVTGLVTGANTITLPTPPAAGSFPPLADWTPTFIKCFPMNAGAVGALVTPDLNSITNTNGAVVFTVYSTGNTACRMEVY